MRHQSPPPLIKSRRKCVIVSPETMLLRETFLNDTFLRNVSIDLQCQNPVRITELFDY